MTRHRGGHPQNADRRLPTFANPPQDTSAKWAAAGTARDWRGQKHIAVRRSRFPHGWGLFGEAGPARAEINFSSAPLSGATLGTCGNWSRAVRTFGPARAGLWLFPG